MIRYALRCQRRTLLRIRVSDVLELLSAGATFDQVLEYCPYLEHEDTLAGIQYAVRQTDHPFSCARDIPYSRPAPPALARFIEAELGCQGRHIADVGESR